jgi:uncharacterized protein (TIGR03000 family)
MYSVILMAAMTAPADATSWGWHHGSCSGSSCSGSSCRGTCGGYSCGGSSCSGSSCSGGRHHWGIFGHHSSCNGCSGGSVHGGGACYGYAFGGINYGFAGCYGSCYGSYTNYFSYWSQPVASGYGYGMPMRVGPPAKMDAPIAPIAPAGDPKPPVKPVEPPKKPTDKIEEETTGQATVIVTVPADAALYANGVKTRQTSTERHFITPPLEAGMIYTYTLSVEVMRNGQMVKESRQVDVYAGAEIRVAFDAADATRVVVGE